ncbi:uncharacterized protein LOC144163783 [Haemaphysalis longicornis]
MPVNLVDVGQQPPSPVPPVICAGTIRQRDPPFFTGKGDYDADDWLSTFERVSVYNKWDDKAKLSNVEYYLREVAEVWFWNNGRTIRTWGEFKTLFAEAFNRPAVRKLHAEQCLRVRAQQPGENFTSYIEDVVDLCRRINMDMSEQEKIRHILKGIEDDAFQMLMSKDPKTVAEIIKLCQSYDQLRRQRSFVRQSLGTGAELSSLSFSSEQASLEMRIKDFVREEVARQLSLVPFEEQPAPSLPQAVQRTVREQVAEALSPAHQSPTPAAPLTVPTMATIAPPVTAPLTYAECAKGDPWIATIVNFLSSPSTLPQPRALRRQAAHFAIRDNLFYRRNYMPDGRKWLLVVPWSLRVEPVPLGLLDPPSMSRNDDPQPAPTPINCAGAIREQDPPSFNGTEEKDGQDCIVTFERMATDGSLLLSTT